MNWGQFDSGKSIGCMGSEDGTIVLGEEHTDGARVTLERGGSTAPWSVTCRIYGAFMHTAFATDESENRRKNDEMTHYLVQIMQEDDDESRY